MIPLLEKILFLKSSPLFSALHGEELASVARVTEPVRFQEGDSLFHEGDPGDALYLVVSGSVRIDRGGNEIAILGPREAVGEMALLDGQPRSATATAVEPVTALYIDQASFDTLVERSPALARGIFRALCQRLRMTTARVTD